MAKLCFCKNALAHKVFWNRALVCFCVCCAMGGWVIWLAALMQGQPFVWVAPAALCGLSGAMTLTARAVCRQIRIYSSGLRGERTVAQLLSSLPDAYQIAVNARFTIGQRDTELDFVVAGPHGVTIVETKHHGGHITGLAQAAQWAQQKQGSAAGRYQKQFANPLLQAAIQTRHLERYLRENGCATAVRAVVYFSNPAASISIGGSTGTPVLCARADDLCAYLRKKSTAPDARTLSPAARIRILKLLRLR